MNVSHETLAKEFIKGEFPMGTTDKEIIKYLSKLIYSYHHELIKVMKIANRIEKFYLKYKLKFSELRKKQ